jgi:caa(3)-type oxidase subunit IV
MSAPATETPAVTESHGHDHDSHGGSMYAHVRPYLIVGIALFIFTAVTVALSYVNLDKIMDHGNMKIGLAVATFKVGLVAMWFMHLKNERATIWRPLIFTVIFFSGLFALVLLHHSDPIPTTIHTHR